MNALADEAGQSRSWAGIHFPTGVRVGLALGRAVAQKVVERADDAVPSPGISVRQPAYPDPSPGQARPTGH